MHLCPYETQISPVEMRQGSFPHMKIGLGVIKAEKVVGGIDYPLKKTFALVIYINT